MRLDLHPFADVEEARRWARGEIEGAAAAARGRFITLTPGQEAIYQAKYAEALTFDAAAAAGRPEAYPWIAAEARRSGMPMSAVADRIKRKGDLWNLVHGPQIEALRVAAKDQLEALTEIGRVVSAARAAVTAMDAVQEEGG
jgi:hypothetical protein